MLTLRDLKKMIQTPENTEKIPTDKFLKERKIPVVVSKRIGNGEGMALVTVYENGYAMYQTAGRVTVFPVSSCRYEYESVTSGTPVRMEESFFDEKEWYLSLMMIGEDRIVSNSLSRDRNHKCFSYHAIAEDYGEMEDKLTQIEEQVSQKQMVELLMSVLTEKQKEILKKVYWEQKTHKQIASMYGMSRSSVSDAVHKALMKISRSFDENGEPR